MYMYSINTVPSLVAAGFSWFSKNIPKAFLMVIITLLTQVRKEKNGKINFRPGIEPGTQRLGVQYTRHQAITQDKVYLPILPYVLPVVVGGSATSH